MQPCIKSYATILAAPSNAIQDIGGVLNAKTIHFFYLGLAISPLKRMRTSESRGSLNSLSKAISTMFRLPTSSEPAFSPAVEGQF